MVVNICIIMYSGFFFCWKSLLLIKDHMQNLKKKLKPPKLSRYEVNLTLDGLTGSGTTADGLTTGTCLEWPVNEQIN